jgi:hypothetical protein
MIKFFAYIAWECAEFFHIDMDRLAPHIFALMIGCKNYKEVKDVN